MSWVDAHQHYWRLARADYGWLTPRQGALYRDFLPEHLTEQLEACGVGASVLVQAAPTEAETRFLLQLARRHRSIAGVVGWVDFEAPDVQARLHALLADGAGLLKGVRPMIQDLPDPRWLGADALDRAFDALVQLGLSFDALVRPEHLRLLEHRLQRHPDLRAVLDHAGKPDIAGGDFKPWAAQLSRLARGTSLYCKLSGLLTEAAVGAGVAELEPFVACILDCFGPERVMWGSDWPMLTTRAPYEAWLAMALEAVRRHAPGHEQAVFADNAVRFYRLELGGTAAKCP